MEATIIKIGNSKGLRLSKAILEQYNIKDKVQLIFEMGQIILKPIEKPRNNWEAAFIDMNAAGDDKLLINSVLDDDFEEWN
jgi:antitoxin MazE